YDETKAFVEAHPFGRGEDDAADDFSRGG
ncbi:MAG: hypothetical protein QOJ03_2565, partial [Frankiaceae bacterium]|nr:hypothetical protein [Frankiaceae bacterium]